MYGERLCPYGGVLRGLGRRLQLQHEAAVSIIRRLVEWPGESVTLPTRIWLNDLIADARAFMERQK